LLQKREVAKGTLTISTPKKGVFAANDVLGKQNAAKHRCALLLLVSLHRVFKKKNDERKCPY
jgi:hypothetical protein